MVRISNKPTFSWEQHPPGSPASSSTHVSAQIFTKTGPSRRRRQRLTLPRRAICLAPTTTEFLRCSTKAWRSTGKRCHKYGLAPVDVATSTLPVQGFLCLWNVAPSALRTAFFACGTWRLLRSARLTLPVERGAFYAPQGFLCL